MLTVPAMAVAVHISPQKMSRDDYERVIKDLEDSDDGDPDGRAFHACAARKIGSVS